MSKGAAMMELILTALGGYLIGSIPTGYWMGRVLKGIDIRTVGSGNVGATNVFRSVGRAAGLATLALDILKGFLAVWLALFLWGARRPR
jgi:glycerol-3-phosphate acyltransferase PlsY